MQDNNTTLHKDINLIERENGYWDYEFQYGDYVIGKDKQSLRNGLIIACLTSWNYLNRQGNPTYETFGNRAYEELKKKKSSMVEYTIRQYFIEVLNRMRRVNRIIDIKVLNHPTDTNAYNVQFTVEAINDEIATGRFSISTTTKLSTSYLRILQDHDIANPINPVNFTISITTEYGNPLANELIYAYHILSDGTEEYLGAYGLTDENGTITIPVYPFDELGYDTLRFKFNGNNEFNGWTSDDYQILSVPFFFEVDNDSHLIVIKSKTYELDCWIGEIVDNISNITYNANEPNKCFLLQENENDYIKYYFTNGRRTRSINVYQIINKPDDLAVGDIRLFVEDTDETLYMIEDHIYADLL